MAKPNLDRVLRATPDVVRSAVARSKYDLCTSNATWIRFENDPDVTNLFLTRMAKRYSPITKAQIFASEPLEKGSFYVDGRLVDIYFWANGALLLDGERYELFVHKKDVDKWIK